jgi:hypothetical protein
VQAQKPHIPPIDETYIQSKIEEIAETSDDELDYSEIMDQLYSLQNNPLNLNKASFEDFKQIFFLNDLQILSILRHRERYGDFLSLYELQSLPNFDMELIQHILPFVSVKKQQNMRHASLKEIIKNSKHDIFVRYQRVLQEQEGFSSISDSLLAENPNSRYLGSAGKIYSRYRVKYYNSISIGITAEKDAGEEFFKGSQKQGFDYYSGHFYLRDFGIVKRVAIGDYQVQFGQGLTLWSGLSFGKSSDAINIKKNGQGIRPYTSVGENLFMRGAATTLTFKNIDFTAFYSKKRIDANINTSDTSAFNNGEELIVTSLQQTGIHAKPSELDDKDAIGETIYGGRISYQKAGFSVGVTGLHYYFDGVLNRDLQLYNQFEFSGISNSNFGADYSFIIRNLHFFGEAAISENGAKAIVNGVYISPDPRFSLALLYRHYDVDYQALYSNGFSEGSKTLNENGIYLGMESRFSKQWVLSAYYDLYDFPWLKYRVDAPSQGHDYLIQLKYRRSKKATYYIRYKKEDKFLNGDILNQVDISPIVPTSKESFRVNMIYHISETIRFKNRIEYLHYSKGENQNSEGYLMYHDIAYKPKNIPFAFTFRYALFDTDDYDSRIYSYENDVLYAYSIPAYYYKGSRIYFIVKYRLNRNFDFWFRIANSYYSNKNIIGSGLNEISGKNKTEIKLQMRIKL